MSSRQEERKKRRAALLAAFNTSIVSESTEDKEVKAFFQEVTLAGSAVNDVEFQSAIDKLRNIDSGSCMHLTKDINSDYSQEDLTDTSTISSTTLIRRLPLKTTSDNIVLPMQTTTIDELLPIKTPVSLKKLAATSLEAPAHPTRPEESSTVSEANWTTQHKTGTSKFKIKASSQTLNHDTSHPQANAGPIQQAPAPLNNAAAPPTAARWTSTMACSQPVVTGMITEASPTTEHPTDHAAAPPQANAGQIQQPMQAPAPLSNAAAPPTAAGWTSTMACSQPVVTGMITEASPTTEHPTDHAAAPPQANAGPIQQPMQAPAPLSNAAAPPTAAGWTSTMACSQPVVTGMITEASPTTEHPTDHAAAPPQANTGPIQHLMQCDSVTLETDDDVNDVDDVDDVDDDEISYDDDYNTNQIFDFCRLCDEPSNGAEVATNDKVFNLTNSSNSHPPDVANDDNVAFNGNDEECRRKTILSKSTRQQKKLKTGVTGNTLKRVSDSEMRERAFNFPIMMFGNLACSTTCEYGGRCAAETQVKHIIEARECLWGAIDGCVKTTKQRSEYLLNQLRDAYSRNLGTFTFAVSGRKVCEEGYRQILGLCQGNLIGGSPRQWNTLKQIVIEDIKDNPNLIAELRRRLTGTLEKPKGSPAIKLDHATAYITYMADLLADTSPTVDGLLVLPFEDVKTLHEDYLFYCANQFINLDQIAGESTFRKAFENVSHVRLLNCKGSFKTCEICNMANELIRNKAKRFSKAQREVIVRFKAAHVKQQAREREELERKKLACRDLYHNQPKMGLLFSDGMTIFTTNTPKLGSSRSIKTVKPIQTRLIAVEAYCGPVATRFCYYTDDLVSGGANIMIEVQRQALKDLGEILRDEHNMELPKKFCFQFDNCSENKNKEMFSYLSLLVEAHYFDEIEVNFLIVGHTHASIDQFFSTLSAAVSAADVIGSPLALIQLFIERHNLSEKQSIGIKRSKQLRVYYDFATAIRPFVNTNIKYYSVPHCFRIFRIFNSRAVMQYKHFSDSKWFPEPPPGVYINSDSTTNENDQVQEIIKANSLDVLPTATASFALMNGEKHVATSLNPKNMDSSTLCKDLSIAVAVQCISQLRPELVKLSENATILQLHRMADFGAGGDEIPRSKITEEDIAKMKAALNAEMKAASTHKYGYIVWLDYTKASTKVGSVLAEKLSPEPFDTASLLRKLEIHKDRKERGTALKLSINRLEKECNLLQRELNLLDPSSIEFKEKKLTFEQKNVALSTAQEQWNEEKLDDINAQPTVIVKNNVINNRATTVYETPVVSSFSKTLSTKEQRLYHAAENISSSARAMLSIIGPNELIEIIPGNTFQYKILAVNTQEVTYYQERSSLEGVLRGAAEAYMSSKPWTLLPLEKPTAAMREMLDVAQQRAIEEQTSIEMFCEKVMVRGGQLRSDGEILSREKQKGRAPDTRAPKTTRAMATTAGLEDATTRTTATSVEITAVACAAPAESTASNPAPPLVPNEDNRAMEMDSSRKRARFIDCNGNNTSKKQKMVKERLERKRKAKEDRIEALTATILGNSTSASVGISAERVNPQSKAQQSTSSSQVGDSLVHKADDGTGSTLDWLCGKVDQCIDEEKKSGKRCLDYQRRVVDILEYREYRQLYVPFARIYGLEVAIPSLQERRQVLWSSACQEIARQYCAKKNLI